ncbi:hypothetical protein [Oscillibacter sp.]|uniref:hypothetical protein n=1 Tax=Oscillibacter sp. TaxID=1945593 RepID=UPI0028A6503C|nr:hypothetical protein [Oscillibacter sp.]
MNRIKFRNSLVAFLGVGAGLTGVTCFLKHRKQWRLEFQKTCFYMATLDDEICRRELDGMVIGKKTIAFPPRRETLYHRYEVFREMYHDLSPKKLEKQVAALEKRLTECNEKGHEER